MGLGLKCFGDFRLMSVFCGPQSTLTMPVLSAPSDTLELLKQFHTVLYSSLQNVSLYNTPSVHYGSPIAHNNTKIKQITTAYVASALT